MALLQQNSTAASEYNVKDKQNRYWTATEHKRFLEALDLYFLCILFIILVLVKIIRRRLAFTLERDLSHKFVPIFKNLKFEWYFKF